MSKVAFKYVQKCELDEMLHSEYLRGFSAAKEKFVEVVQEEYMGGTALNLIMCINAGHSAHVKWKARLSMGRAFLKAPTTKVDKHITISFEPLDGSKKLVMREERTTI
jgi:hypothetical protein